MTPPPIRLAFVLHVMQVAGAEVLVAETIRRLGPALDPIVFCLDGVGRLGEEMQKQGIPVISLSRRPGLDWKVAGRMAREICARGIEVVHAHQYSPFFYAALAKILLGGRCRIMFTEHGRHYPDAVSRKRRFINRWLLNRLANEINAVCAFSAGALRENDGFSRRRIEVIENGIDAGRYAAEGTREGIKTRIGLDPTRRYLICVARFHPVKDHPTLLRAFASVAQNIADADLLLAGDGPRKEELQQLCVRLGIAERVRFLGVRFDVPDLLRASEIFLLTSVSEAASITLLEAMAAALPVIVTDVGGNPEIVRHGKDGLLIPRSDSRAAADACISLLNDPERAAQLGVCARERVLEKYSLERTVRRYYERYLEMVARS